METLALKAVYNVTTSMKAAQNPIDGTFVDCCFVEFRQFSLLWACKRSSFEERRPLGRLLKSSLELLGLKSDHCSGNSKTVQRPE